MSSVTYAPIANLNFKQKRKSSGPSLVREEEMPEPTEEELQSLYRDLAAAGKSALLLWSLASLMNMYNSVGKEFYPNPGIHWPDELQSDKAIS